MAYVAKPDLARPEPQAEVDSRMEDGEYLLDPGPKAKLEVSGKIECHHRMMTTVWIYLRSWSSSERRHSALQGWLDYYNQQRAHRGL